MSKTIWKYHIDIIGGEQELQIPAGSTPLIVGMQDDVLYIWVETFPNIPKTTYLFEVVGTGHDHSPYLGHYLGSVFQRVFVRHVYWRIK